MYEKKHWDGDLADLTGRLVDYNAFLSQIALFWIAFFTGSSLHSFSSVVRSMIRQFFGSANTTETVYSTTPKDCSLNLNSKRHHRPQACKQVNALKLVMNCLNFLSEQIFGSFSQHLPTYHLAIKHQKKIPFTCLNLEPWNYHPQERLQVVYMCSSLLQLAPGSRDLSQAEKRITVM